jgi:hypothetical protein
MFDPVASLWMLLIVTWVTNCIEVKKKRIINHG